MGNPRSWRRPAGGFVAIVALVACCAGPALGAVPTVTQVAPGVSPIAGIQDDRLVSDPDPAARVRLLAEAGAALIRVDLRWDLVAPTKPVNAASPADAAYQWGRYDTIVATARQLGVEVLFTVYGTPDWARDPSVSLDPRYANWSIRPADPATYGAFGEAAARRFGPLGVTKWEALNEPNIPIFLRPQYVRAGGRWVAESPKTYSGMLKAFYAGVKRGHSAAIVAGGVTAPAGDRCPDCPVDAPPVRVTSDDFIAALAAPGLQPPMDAVSHHPYPITAPRAFTPPGRSYVDLYNLSVWTAAVDRTYLKGKPIWLTEYGFSTRPVTQYPTSFSAAKQATFIVDAFRRMRANARVKIGVYYLLQDHPEWASGVLTQAGAKKQGYQALALPFASRASGPVRAGQAVKLIGQVRNAAAATTVQIQRKVGSNWVTARSVRTARDGSFAVRVTADATVVLRASWRGTTRAGSLARRTSPPVSVVVAR